MEQQKFLEGLTALLHKCFGESEDGPRHPEGETSSGTTVSKSVDLELKQATFLVLSPEETDLQGDIYNEEEVRKACHSFQTHCMKANLFHIAETDLASIVENYITPTDFYLEDKFIKKGSWLQVWQVHDDEVWDLVKKGEINGVSIGCPANYEVLEDDQS